MKIKGNLTEHIRFTDLFQNQSSYTMSFSPDILLMCEMFEEWIAWVKRDVNIHGCYRTSEYNKKVNGNACSNHLKGKAIDFDVCGINHAEKFVKYATKWKQICEKHGVVGEAGLYTWGYHFGYQTYSKTFYNWDSRSGKQKNMAFKI